MTLFATMLVIGWLIGIPAFARYMLNIVPPPETALEFGGFCVVLALWPVMWPIIAFLRWY